MVFFKSSPEDIFFGFVGFFGFVFLIDLRSKGRERNIAMRENDPLPRISTPTRD